MDLCKHCKEANRVGSNGRGGTDLWASLYGYHEDNGIRRVIGLSFLDFLPGGQLAQFYEVYSSTGNMNPAVMLCGSLVFAVGTTVPGLRLFRKKDLK